MTREGAVLAALRSRKEEPMPPLRFLIPLASAAVLLPLAVACGGDDDKKTSVTVVAPTASATQSQAKAQLCTELASLKTAATQAQALTANSTVEDAKKAQAQLKVAQEKVRLAARAVQNIKIDELDAAVVKLDTAMGSVPASATLSSAAAQIQPQAQAVLQAEVNVHTATPCP
jgi:hypothetical protein